MSSRAHQRVCDLCAAGTLRIEVLDKGALGGAEGQPQSSSSSSSRERPPARFAQSAVTVPSNGKSAAPLVRPFVCQRMVRLCSLLSCRGLSEVAGVLCRRWSSLAASTLRRTSTMSPCGGFDCRWL